MAKGSDETKPRSTSRKKQSEPVVLDWKLAYWNRDLSWLEFNRRVLHEALDARNPPLERLKFLAIFGSNLDEFFMKRIELVKRRQRRGADSSGEGGLTTVTLAQIRETVEPLLSDQAACFRELLPVLRERGICLLDWDELNEAQKQECHAFFRTQVFPILTPLAFDPGHPFPFLSNLSTSLGVLLRHPETGEPSFARVKVPPMLPSWLGLRSLSDGQLSVFVRLYEVIARNLEAVFPGMQVIDTTLFRVTRDAEVELNEEAIDLREQVEEELRQRRFEPVVRLEFMAKPDPWVRDLLVGKFELHEDQVYSLPGELEYSGLMAIASLPRSELRDPPWVPLDPLMMPDPEADIFATIRAGDVLVHHPYESFDSSVERFIRAASQDPQVQAIKMTVYRVGDDTPFVKSLVRAAESGKQVVCLIEVRARFDEARNLLWADELERVGAHVVYGVVGLKTHTKLALVVRQEPDGMRCYAHIGTGNYHVKTARLYTDVGLFTCTNDLTEDVVDLFHFLTGRSRKRDYRKLLVSPVAMRTRFLELIERESAHAKAGRPARIVAKMNQLEDRDLCEALCAASQSGVEIDLIVRGFCCVLPGLPGLTERIRVISIIGRFLEHSRVFFFANGKAEPLEGDYLIGSADWMYRNLSARVEAVAPVENRVLKERLWELLDLCLRDQRQAWDVLSDGLSRQRKPPVGATGVALDGVQTTLIELTRKRSVAPRI